MKVKHLKTKTIIELTPEETNQWIETINTFDKIVDNTVEMSDMYLSDLGKLQTTRLKLTQLFGLSYNRSEYKYTKDKEVGFEILFDKILTPLSLSLDESNTPSVSLDSGVKYETFTPCLPTAIATLYGDPPGLAR